MMRLPERPIYALAMIGGLGAVGAGAAGVVFATRGDAWMTLAFQSLVVAAGIIGALSGFGKFRSGPSLALLCVAGTLLAAGVLGFVGAGGNVSPGNLLRMREGALTAGRLPAWVMVAEVGLAGVFMLLSGVLALNRKPEESWRRLGLGVLLALPIGVCGAALVATPLGARIAEMHWLASGSLLVVGFLVFVGLASASAHQIINAFAAGLPDYTKKPGSAG